MVGHTQYQSINNCSTNITKIKKVSQRMNDNMEKPYYVKMNFQRIFIFPAFIYIMII